MNLWKRIILFCTRVQNKKKEDGYFFAIGLIVETIYYKLIKLSVLPVVLFIICLRPWIKIRFLALHCRSIGHNSISTEILLCKLDQELDAKSKIIFLNTVSHSRYCNKQLNIMWRRVIPLLPYPWYHLFKHVEEYLKGFYGINPAKVILGEASHDRWDVLETSKQHLQFTQEELLEGERYLGKMGIPVNAKFICLLVRDEAHYLSDAIYTKMAGFRNADIFNYKKAALFLANQGYYVIRMGKSVNKAFDLTHPKIIDYACSSFRSDFMDIFLSARCYFFMTNFCGLDGVAHAFRRPILATNMTPFGYFDLGYPVKLFLAKKIINKKTGQLISFKQQNGIFHLGSSLEFFNQMLSDYSLKIVDNTEDEILEATKEMMLRMQGNWCDTESSEALQRKLWSKMPKERFHLNGDGTIKTMPVCKYQARYCTSDLLYNSALLEDERVVP